MEKHGIGVARVDQFSCGLPNEGAVYHVSTSFAEDVGETEERTGVMAPPVMVVVNASASAKSEEEEEEEEEKEEEDEEGEEEEESGEKEGTICADG